MEVVSPGRESEIYLGAREWGARDQVVGNLRLLWQHRRGLFRAAACGLLAATLVAFLIPKQYESTTRLMPPDNQSSSGMALVATLSGKLGGGIGGMASDLLGTQGSGALFVGILGSRTVQDNLVDKFELKRVYRKSTQEDARGMLAIDTSIAEDRKSGIITITVTDRSPQRAAALAQQYVIELNDVVSHLSSSSAGRERVFLEQRLGQVRQDLEAAEQDFSQFASKTGAIDIKEQGIAMLTAAANLQGQIIAAESELEGLKQIYTDNNVRVRSLQARVSELRAQLEKVGGKEGAAKEDIAKDALNPNDESTYPSIRKLPLLGVSYADLYRRTKVEEAVFETLTQEYELAKVAEAKEIPSVKILDPANVPEKKSFPPRLTLMFVGMFFAFILAVVWVLARARWEEIAPEDGRKRFAQEVFRTVNASMPWAAPNGSRFQAATHRAWITLRGQGVKKDSTSSVG